MKSTFERLSFDCSKLVNFVLSEKYRKVFYCIPNIARDQVLNILSKISLRKATDVDGIESHVLHVAAPVIAPTIAKLINCSFATGIYPQPCKTAKVLPFYKSGNIDDFFNYRPISVLPILSKVIEKHIHDTLYEYLCANNLIYPRQSGFRQKHSTETALIRIIDELLFNLNKNQVSGMVLVSGEASGHAGHAEHDQKYSRVKNFFTCLKMEVCFEIFFKKSNAALVNYAVSYVHW